MEIEESQQSKKKRNNSKIRIFTTTFLIQYFCLHGIWVNPVTKPSYAKWRHALSY